MGTFLFRGSKLMKTLMLCLAVLVPMAFGQEAVPKTYFGLNIHCCSVNGTAKHGSAPWPPANFGSLRVWDNDAQWLHISPNKGDYDWTILDSWIDHAQSHGVEMMYTFGGIPSWASGDRSDEKCKDKQFNTPGSCHPPADLNEDGSGSNQTFKDFATAVVKHSHGRIKYWETWNEPMNLFFWNGSLAQMVRITEDLRTIAKGADPDAMIVSPGTGWLDERPGNGKTAWNAMTWTDQYLAAGGSKYIDVLATHAYLKGNCPSGGWDLDQLEVRTDDIRKMMKKRGIPEMPLWATEGSWGHMAKTDKPTCTTDPDMQAAYVGQYYIAMWWAGYKRVFWYAWNDWDTGNLVDKESYEPTLGGKAYGEIINWMVGATLKGCDKSSKVWKCTFTRPDGAQYLAIWDGGQTCSNGNCSTVAMKIDPSYVDYLDLAGGKTKIQNNTVPVGLKPIWLESSGASKRK
jgi:hypothetical protein